MIDIAATSDFILESMQTLGERPLEGGALDAQRIPGRPDTYVAVSAQKELFILLGVSKETNIEERRLKALRVLTGDEFTIVDALSDEVVKRRFAVIALRPGNEDLASLFAVVAATLLSTLPDLPSQEDVIEFVDNLTDLVAPRRTAAYSTVVGLWGELWIISRSDDPEKLANAWHGMPGERFDFSLEGSRLEVKTTSTSVRTHEFGLDQLALGDSKPTWIASLTIVSDPSGESIIDLLDGLLGLLPGALAARVNRIALQTIAGDIESLQDFTFAPSGAEPLLTYAAHDLPRPFVEQGSGVSGVRFRADLDRIAPVAHSVDELLNLLAAKD